MSDRFANRQQRLLSQLSAEGLDACLITNPLNVSYLTGFAGDSSFLFLSPGRSLLLSDGRYTTQIAAECPNLETHIRPPHQTIQESASQVLEKLGSSSVGVESAHLTLAEFQILSDRAKTIQWKPASNRVEKLRTIKDDDEIARIRQAIHFAERAFGRMRSQMSSQHTEKDLADDLENQLRRSGAEGSAFPIIVAVGPQSALPHAIPSNERRVGDAPVLLIDWGATGSFYKSDLTRVLISHHNTAFPGMEAKIRQVYAVVLEAQAKAMAAIHPGATAGAVDAAARKVIQDAGFGDFFTHSIGHGFGLQIHEAPLMKKGSEFVLEPGMVVTVEPGIYLPGEFGIRIEDDLLVTPDGQEVLTGVPKNLEDCFVDF